MSFEPNENRVLAAMQYVLLWVSLFLMFAFFILMFRADFQVPQKTTLLKIDIKNKVNICLPDDPEYLKDDSIF